MKQNTLKAALILATAAVFVHGLGSETVISQSQEPRQKAVYPAPSFPPLADPKTIDDVMPYAREMARNKSAFLGRGFGEIADGETIIVVTTTTDPEADIYVNAIVAALEERNIDVILMRDYEIAGVTLEQARALDDYMKKNVERTSEDGWTEACGHLDKEFLRNTRPDLYELCHPAAVEDQLPAALKPVFAKMRGNRLMVPNHVNDYMDKNPGIRGVFYSRGGPTWMYFHPHEMRWMSNFTFDNRWDVVAPTGSFPADVWMLSEEISMEPLASADKVTVTDPEGTDVWWEMSEDQAQRWSKGVYLRGHLFMFPQEAYGQYALSVVNYPAMDPEYIPVEEAITSFNGVVAATTSHAGFFPLMEQIWEDGYLKEVRGGGLYGELLRTLMKQPGINEVVYPLRKKPGYFFHYETAMGTNPKVVRQDLNKNWGTAGERARDGALHWGLGATYWNDPGSMGGESGVNGKLKEFGTKNRVPSRHGFHLHTYFNTMKLRLRGSDRWITTIDKGRSTSLDHPEVRALASRYGDPDKILATEWVPEIPGINAPGSYQEYAQDPYTYSAEIMRKVIEGTYNVYNPDVRP